MMLTLHTGGKEELLKANNAKTRANFEPLSIGLKKINKRYDI